MRATISKPAVLRPGRYWLDRESVLGSLMLMPAILYIVLLVGIPFVLAIVYSFSDVTIGDQAIHFVGLKTFERVVNDHTFRTSLRNTFVFTFVSQALVIVLGKILALVLVQDFPGKWIIRFLIILPWATPIALGALGWLWMLDSLYSSLDWILRQMGLLGANPHLIVILKPFDWLLRLLGQPSLQGILGPANHMYWLGEPKLAMGSIIAVQVWRFLPLVTIILLAGLTAIPQDVKDAVAIDGVGYFRELFEVTIPLMLPIMVVATLFGVVFTFTDMTVVYILTRGGPPPGNPTHVLASWAFFKGIEGGALAEGAAIAIFLFPVLLAITVLMLRMAARAEVD
jgi:multiple sugar transport system permease protein